MQVSEVLTAMEVKDWTKLSLAYIRVLTARNEIPHIRIGRRVLYRAEEIEQWMKSKRSGGGENENNQ
ncbi:MAG: helix-turn-helix domain-containing protein [Deltaproteobacteria bacterium]|nr:helix-turn-helix domain-containing protein [Deltaproteobacteria bacterium]